MPEKPTETARAPRRPHDPPARPPDEAVRPDGDRPRRGPDQDPPPPPGRRGRLAAAGRRPAAAPAAARRPPPAAPAEPAPATAPRPPGVVIESPMVGTFYASSSPDAPPFVSVGSAVRARHDRLRHRGHEGLHRHPRRASPARSPRSWSRTASPSSSASPCSASTRPERGRECRVARVPSGSTFRSALRTQHSALEASRRCFSASWWPTAARSPCGSSAPARSWASRSSPSTRRPTATPPTWRWPTGPSASARPPSADSYLNIPRIIAAAEVADVQAIHPGYGFLSENPHFAEICRSCNFEFIGPPHEAIRKMGLKTEAKAVAAGRQGPLRPRLRRPRRQRRRGAPARPRDRLPRPHQGRGRRRRQGDAGLPRRVDPASPRSRPPATRPRPRSRTPASTSRSSSTAPGTSRSRSSPTRTATSSTAGTATARSSAGTRSSSRSRPPRPCR